MSYCLNFGSPENGHVAWQLERSTTGLADACEALGVPVVGGNVSLYNETDAGPIYPTPVIGMVGELGDVDRTGGLALREDDAIALLGPFAPSLAGSELAKLRGELEPGLTLPPVELIRAATELVREGVRAGALRCAHDIGDGGLACALAETAIAGAVGLRADLDGAIESRGLSPEACLFGEGPGGFVVAGERAAIEELVDMVGDSGAVLLGASGGDRIELSGGGLRVDVALSEAERAWRSLDARMAEAAVS